MWNLEKWYRWTALQGRSWDTDVENKRMDTKEGKPQGRGDGGVMNWAIGIDMYKKKKKSQIDQCLDPEWSLTSCVVLSNLFICLSLDLIIYKVELKIKPNS